MHAHEKLSLFARLRRSTRLAFLLMLVAISRLLGTYSCLADDLQGGVNQHEVAVQRVVSWVAGPHQPGSAWDAYTVTGSCHCSCHQPAALPGDVVVMLGQIPNANSSPPQGGSAPIFLDRTLRPPIG